jgi:hypothetical protein
MVVSRGDAAEAAASLHQVQVAVLCRIEFMNAARPASDNAGQRKSFL